MPRLARSTWRSLDPNGDTSSIGCSQVHWVAPVRGGRVFRQAQGKRAQQRSVGAIQLDRRRQPVGREVGERPHGERVGRRRAGVRPEQIFERGDLIDLLDRLLQALLQIFPEAERLGTKHLGDEPFLGFGRMGEQRGIHRDRRAKQRDEEDRQARALRDAADPSLDAGQRRRRGASEKQSHPHRPDRDRRADDPDDERRSNHARQPAAGGDGAPQQRPRTAPEGGRQPVDCCRAPDHRPVQQHQRELHGDARRAQRVQREVEQIEIGVGDHAPEQSLYAQSSQPLAKPAIA